MIKAKFYGAAMAWCCVLAMGFVVSGASAQVILDDPEFVFEGDDWDRMELMPDDQAALAESIHRVAQGGGAADVALCVLPSAVKWGTVGNITAYSIGTTSVNIGQVNLNWIQSGTNHPVISQNMFRLMDGKFEHIGQGWLKHSFCALQIDSPCTPINCPNQGGCLSFLAPGCQDPYTAGRNGQQSLLGPKFEVNAHTGDFLWPHGNGTTGTLGQRIQVHNSDLGLPGAQYFIEGQYIAKDDAAAGNGNNNSSYRNATIQPAPNFDISLSGGTQFEKWGIRAWQDNDPSVILAIVQVPDEGLFVMGYTATDNGDGTYHYEYAVQNVNSDRSAGSFSIPVPPSVTLTNIGFHDVDYHSGEPFDGTDWSAVVEDGAITWATAPFSQNPNANALRWATLYNFRFDANSSPQATEATLGLFKPGAPDSVTVGTRGPAPLKICLGDLNFDGMVDAADLAQLLGAWGPNPGNTADFNGDGVVDARDLAQLLGAWGPCP